MIVHRIWLDDPLPDRYIYHGNKWRQHGYELHDWQHTSSLPPLHNQALFDKAQTHYPNDWKRFRADLLRLELLYIYGGIYADCDIEIHSPLPYALPHAPVDSCIVGRSPQSGHPITNALIIAPPQHPYIRALIEGCESAVERFGHLALARSIGPWHLTRTYEYGGWDVTIIPDLYESDYLTHHWANARRKNRESGWRF